MVDFANLDDVAAASAAADAAAQLANQALSAVVPVNRGTTLLSGGSVAFAGNRSFIVAAATYLINGVQYTSAETTVTLGAADATNPRLDAIVLTTVPSATILEGTPGVNPATPDIDPGLYLWLKFVQIDAAAAAVAVATTDIYRDSPAAWPGSVRGGQTTINGASTNNPRTGANDIEGTNVVANDWVRLTAAAAVSLSAQRQLVLYVRPKAGWPNQKSLQLTFMLAGVKVGQSVSIQNGSFGFATGTLAYQQIVIPITQFSIPATSLVDALDIKAVGGGASFGWYIDDVFLEGASTAVAQPVITALQAEVENLRIRTILIPIIGIAVGVHPECDTQVDFAGKILSWTILGCGVSGSIVIDLWKCSAANYGAAHPVVGDAITTGGKPTLTTAYRASSNVPATWNSSFNAGDIFRPNVDSVTNLSDAILALKVQVA